MMIKLATLNNCDICNNIKQLLLREKIDFIDISCSDHSNNKKCNEFEKICGQNLYPILFINNAIITLTNDYSKLGKIHTNLNHSIIYCYSIDNMFITIKKLLNL